MSDVNALIEAGNQLEDRGDARAALECYERALGYAPDSQRAWLNVGNAKLLLGQQEGARAAFEAALARGDFAPAHLNLGNLHTQQGEALLAVGHYRKALALRPGWDQAALGLCLAMQQMRDPETVGCLRELVSQHPKLLKARLMLAELLSDTQPHEALLLLQGAPTHPAVFACRAKCHAKTLDAANACIEIARALELAPDHHDYAGSLAFYSLYDETQTPDSIRSAFARYTGLRWPQGNLKLPYTPRPRIRIAYISGDFIAHPLMHYARTLFEQHDRRGFEVIGISSTGRPDAVTAQLRGLCDRWLDITTLDDSSACREIRALGVDVLIDLSGHSTANRLGVLALRAAPVQMTAIGVLASTGMPNVDYRIADPYTDPPGLTEAWHSEQLLRMPRFHACYTQLREFPSATRVPGSAFTFGFFNNAMKLTPRLIDDFAQILDRVAGSRLLVLGVHNPTIASILRSRLSAHGIADERVEVRTRLDLAEFSALMASADIAIDAFPYSGGITSIETLLTGVPIVSIAGTRPSSRNGLAILSNIGMDDWIAYSHAELVEIACRKAGDRVALDELRRSLPKRVRQSPLMDAPLFIADWEALISSALRNR